MKKINFNRYYINITGKLNENDIGNLTKAPKTIKWIQFWDYEPTKTDLVILNDFFRNRPEIYFRLVGVKQGNLKYLPDLKKVRWFGNFEENYFSDLEYLNKVTAIDLDELPRKVDISQLEKYKHTLIELAFTGDIAKKSIKTIRNLQNLQKVKFISSKFENLDFLSNLKLKSFGQYGSRTQNYEVLKTIDTLQHIWIKTNNWQDFSFIEHLYSLRTIELSYCSGITVFPKVEHLKELEKVLLANCNKLFDISELRKVKNCSIRAYGTILKKNNKTLNINAT